MASTGTSRVIRPAESESERIAGYQLIRRRIADPTLHPYMPETQPDGEATQLKVFLALESDELVGAAYFGPSWTDQAEFSQAWEPVSLMDYRDHILSLHGIAVVEQRAGQGIGTELMDALGRYAREGDYRGVIGVADPDSAEFYTKHGYVLLGQGIPITFKVANGTPTPMAAALPIVGESQWFALPLVDGTIGILPDPDGSPLFFRYEPAQAEAAEAEPPAQPRKNR